MGKWFVIYTRKGWERKVNRQLSDKGIENFCPVIKVKRQWSDRIKTLEEPAFRSYIFVKILPDQRTEVRLTEGVVNFLRRNGKPILVKEKEINVLKELLFQDHQMVFAATDLAVGRTEKPELQKQTEAFQTYLDRLSGWLVEHIEKPKLV